MKANSLINDDLKIKTKEKFDQESEECVIGPFNVLSIKLRATKKAVAALHQSNGRFRCLNFIRGSGKNAYVATPFGKIYFEFSNIFP